MSLKYDELERLYNEYTIFENKPQFTFADSCGLRAIFGDEEYEAMILRGEIKSIKIDDDLEVLRAGNARL